MQQDVLTPEKLHAKATPVCIARLFQAATFFPQRGEKKSAFCAERARNHKRADRVANYLSLKLVLATELVPSLRDRYLSYVSPFEI